MHVRSVLVPLRQIELRECAIRVFSLLGLHSFF
jgi:hypothetical protein